MSRAARRRAKLAAAIAETVHRKAKPATPPLPWTSWEIVQGYQRKLQKACARGFELAAKRYANSLASAVSHLQADLGQLERTMSPQRVSSPYPAADIAHDLASLAEEFVEVELPDENGLISVVTEPIVLEEIYLGGFRIVLDWEQIGNASSPYSIEAVDPYPAEPNTEITHPHVSGDKLCEGDGRAAISSALRSGRLLDFFLLVRQVLETYNPASAYVRLSDWEGFHCVDCGDCVSHDDRNSCEQCDQDLCSGCCWSCEDCGQIMCNECRDACGGCDETFCSGCLQDSDNGPLCESCQAQLEDETPEDTNEEERKAAPLAGGTEADPAVNADRVGQAGLPA